MGMQDPFIQTAKTGYECRPLDYLGLIQNAQYNNVLSVLRFML